MDDEELSERADEPVESGALEGESGEGERVPAPLQEDPVESGGLAEEE